MLRVLLLMLGRTDLSVLFFNELFLFLWGHRSRNCKHLGDGAQDHTFCLCQLRTR